jgi:hypothetical protein
MPRCILFKRRYTLDASNVRKVMARVLKRAQLRLYFSLMLNRGSRRSMCSANLAMPDSTDRGHLWQVVADKE